jgi:hypothetical protein
VVVAVRCLHDRNQSKILNLRELQHRSVVVRKFCVAVALLPLIGSTALAQGLGEYGALGGGAVRSSGDGGGAFSSLALALAAIEDTVRTAEPRTWIIIASVSAVLFFLFRRTR